MMLRNNLFRLAAAVAAVGSSFTAHSQSALPTDLNLSRTEAQARFDAATKEFESGNWLHAAELFSELRTHLRSGKAHAIALIREGHARLQLGQQKLARSLLEAGVRMLPSDPALQSDKRLALEDIGDAYERDNEFSLASAVYRQALPLAADPEARIGVLASIARSEMFVDPAAAEQTATTAIGLASRSPDVVRANLENLRGRALLNQHRYPAAEAALTRAVELSGGLTLRADPQDVRLRSDAAIAAALTGHYPAAQRFLAYSGGSLGLRKSLPPPLTRSDAVCDPEQFRDDDLAIVEVNIAKDGRVASSSPVFVSRPGLLAQITAAQVRQWTWFPAQLRQAHPVLRSVARIEVHCVPSEIPIEIINALPWPLERWAASQGIRKRELLGDTKQLESARAELRSREAKSSSPSLDLLVLLDALRTSPLVDATETRAILGREYQIAAALDAPMDVLADLKASSVSLDTERPEERIRRYIALQKSEPFRGDAPAQAYLTFRITNLERQLLRFEDVQRKLVQLANSDELPPENIYRKAANAQLYSFFAAKGQLEDAKRYLRKTGLQSKPCSINSYERKLANSKGAYPTEAQQWGFEGWTRVQFSLGPKGEVRDTRTVIAYPPLVFANAASAYLNKGKYLPLGNREESLPCEGIQEVVYFMLK